MKRFNAWRAVCTATCLCGVAIAKPAAADLIKEVSYSIGPGTSFASAGGTFYSGIHEDPQWLNFIDLVMPGFDIPFATAVEAILTVEVESKGDGLHTNIADFTETLGGSFHIAVFNGFGDSIYSPDVFLGGVLAPGESVRGELEIEKEWQYVLADAALNDFVAGIGQVHLRTYLWGSSGGAGNTPRTLSLQQETRYEATITYIYRVPEPPVFSLLGIGLLALAARRYPPRLKQ